MRIVLTFLAVLAMACSPSDSADPAEPTTASEAPRDAGVQLVEMGDGTWEDAAPAATAALPPSSEAPAAAYQAVPPGFPDADPYTSHAEACLAVVQAEVPRKWQRAVLAWCHHRSYASSRNGVVVSRVDGSQIHDRDRPTAWMFWEKQVLRGVLEPETCPFHRVSRQLKHTANCVKLRRHWPFKDVRLSEHTKSQWAHHPHDMERFGARGPHDWNANAYNHIPGCWDPSQLERFDVSITVTVRYAVKLCEKYGCGDKYDIKRHWSTG